MTILVKKGGYHLRRVVRKKEMKKIIKLEPKCKNCKKEVDRDKCIKLLKDTGYEEFQEIYFCSEECYVNKCMNQNDKDKLLYLEKYKLDVDKMGGSGD